MNTTAQKVQIYRINRTLAPKHQKVITSRGTQTIAALGTHHLIDTYRNVIIDTYVDLDDLELQIQEESKILDTVHEAIEDVFAKVDAERDRQIAASL